MRLRRKSYVTAKILDKTTTKASEELEYISESLIKNYEMYVILLLVFFDCISVQIFKILSDYFESASRIIVKDAWNFQTWMIAVDGYSNAAAGM